MSDQAAGNDIGQLDDPALVEQWAAARDKLVHTPADSAEHGNVKARYGALVSEYRHRVDGWR
jgi:hypothetical protein